MRIALLGTRGVPAQYGGFETAVEEVGRRLVDRGHEVTVYCRGSGGADSYRGMTLVHLPAARRKALETLSHTALSVGHVSLGRARYDAAVVFNAANAPFLPALRLRGIPTALHADGLEWKRAKWGGAGKRYYRAAEALSVRWADAVIADAQGIADYYEDEFGLPTELLAYGAPILRDPPADRLADLGLESGGYHLVVARFEPENHVSEIVDGAVRSGARLPVVVVGSAPYADDYTARVEGLAAREHSGVRLVGGVWDQELLDQLYAHALLYVHGHSVGGTNPSLLRAMGAGTAVAAYDVSFNVGVLGGDDLVFRDEEGVASCLERAEADPAEMRAAGRRLQDRAAELYRWDDVAEGYEKLLEKIAGGHSTRGVASGRRRG
ncbi:DUF1972 domain-containing protein [Mumia sp.]|uniref:DUF1972 domain-containing protein n=1 Tax=Mumia sp. TaxID=1965300 RepID=UPI002605D3B8|nr:DUF1972 domain-containing protein [Mumia sp.]MDD9348381.1 DUF1972 domain-containing protein [Mumia sp.]